MTTVGVGEAGRQLTATVGGSEENGADSKQGGAAAVRGDTGNATSAVVHKARSGGRHEARTATRERVEGWQENLVGDSYVVVGRGGGCKAYGVASKPSRVRGDGGGRKAYGVAETPGGTAKEWEGDSICHRASTPPEWTHSPGGGETPKWQGRTDGGREGT